MKLFHAFKSAPLFAALILAAATVPATAAVTDLVQQGGFAGDWFAPYTHSNSNWTVDTVSTVGVGNTISFVTTPGTASTLEWAATPWDILGSNPGNSASGGAVFVMDAAPEYNGTLKQTLSGLTVGQQYTVSFEQAAGRYVNYGALTTADVHWTVGFGGSTQDAATMTIQPSGAVIGQHMAAQTTAWQSQSLTFTATSASTVLSFMAHGPSGIPPYALLDGISVNAVTAAVPEPSSVALMALGLGCVALVRRKQKRGNKA